MKRYIKSFTTEQLKAKLGDNYPKGGYLYIFKHGIGPGTIPNDVSVVKVKDLPNYYTAVWLDRFLTTDELRQYDIPDETRINELLDRIGYCQKNGDVVPCNEIEACGDIKASSYAIPNKKLVFEDGDSYEFRYTSEEGDVFEPKSGSGNWWTSYIVTPDNKLLSWEFSGRYTPVDAVYGEDFWVEDNSVEACGYEKEIY